jgi:ABC-2 type transport system ATP-binding protein
VRDSLVSAPRIEGYELELIDDHTVEVEVSKTQSLNEVFAHLSAQGIAVQSMRNKVNRLEELFMNLVEQNNEPVASANNSSIANSSVSRTRS